MENETTSSSFKKKIIFCMGEDLQLAGKLFAEGNPNAKIFSEKFVKETQRDPHEEPWENLNEFRRTKRIKNYYLHEITRGGDLIIVTIPNLTSPDLEYLKEAADICEFDVKTCVFTTFHPKQPIEPVKFTERNNNSVAPKMDNDLNSDNDSEKTKWYQKIFKND